MSSYNDQIATELAAALAAAFPAEDVAKTYVPEFDKQQGTDRLVRVCPATDITEANGGTRGDDEHTVTTAVCIWKPLSPTSSQTVAAQVPAQIEFAEQVLSETRRLESTIGSTLWQWVMSSFEPLYDPEMLRDDSEFMCWIAVQWKGNTA